VEFLSSHPVFGFQVPAVLPKMFPSGDLISRATWPNPENYDKQAKACEFICKDFDQFPRTFAFLLKFLSEHQLFKIL